MTDSSWSLSERSKLFVHAGIGTRGPRSARPLVQVFTTELRILESCLHVKYALKFYFEVKLVIAKLRPIEASMKLNWPYSQLYPARQPVKVILA